MLQVGDGVKKWAVLLPTAVLPRPWRVATRRKGLARLEVGKALRTDLLIIGHPKSGNTWLRVMLSRLYQVRHGIPASVIVTSDELARRNPSIPAQSKLLPSSRRSIPLLRRSTEIEPARFSRPRRRTAARTAADRCRALQ